MRPADHFHVEPAIPSSLVGLRRLATNLHWAWHQPSRALFASLDDQLWEACGHDPMRLLEQLPTTRWAGLADDPRVKASLDACLADLDDAVTGRRWFQERSDSPLGLIAYFSPEFGLTETLAQYSGGLGVLAGDHLKAASDLGVPLVAIGLLYRNGYFRQNLTADGYQVERFPTQEPSGLAVTSTGMQISLEVGGEHVAVAIWHVQVGRTNLYLLDTDVEGNSASARSITDRLYGGDTEHRLRQEIVLGIGGVRALRALGLQPGVFHTNEGHAGFLSLERIRELVGSGYGIADAIEAVRAGGVFTTHTPVPAGIDRFPVDLMSRYFSGFATQLGMGFDQLMALGRRADEVDDRFNMAVMSLRLAGRANAVAQLHGEVSREMFQGLWPDVPVDEVPIGAVTNGVHSHTWVAPRIADLLSAGVHPMWDGADSRAWDAAMKLDDASVWAARNTGRSQLVSTVQERLGRDVLDPDALTIGFARRFATYKRATLLLSQPERLAAMLGNPDRPVQFLFAGKAHPADEPGKEMIQAIERFSRTDEAYGRFLFLPDYDMGIARTMYAGADVWLNNPRRPLEACGTSGMKAALNGALNCSILDGWWDEAYDGRNGWAIDSHEGQNDLEWRDRMEAESLFALLEREIVPTFYDRRDGIPHRWLDRVKHGWATIGPVFTAARMVKEYVTTMYEPAAVGSTSLTADDGARARDLASWKSRIDGLWAGVSVAMSPTTTGADGSRSFEASAQLGGLEAQDVRAELLHGPLDDQAQIVRPVVEVLDLVHGDDDRWHMRGLFTPTSAGAYGATIRLVPAHADLSHPMELGRIAWG